MDQAILTIRLQGEGGTGPTQQQRAISAATIVPQAIPIATVVPAATVAGLSRQRSSLAVSAEQNTVTDDFIKILGSLRGTIGGVFGTLAGAALDVVVKFRDLARASEQTAAAQTASARTPAVPAALAQVPTVQSAQAAQIVSGFSKAPQGSFAGAGTSTAAAVGRVGQISKAMVAPQIAGDISGSAFAGLAEAAPIVGAGVAIGLEVNKAFHQLAMSASGPIEALGKFGTAVAQATPDPAVAVRGFSNYFKSLADVPTIMTPFLSVISSATGSLADFMQAVDGIANRYGPLSGPVTAAQAQSEVRQLLGDFRRAQTLTPQLVRYIQARTELQQRIEDVKVKFLVQILPIANRALDIISAHLAFLEQVKDKMGEVATLVAAFVPGGADALRRIRQLFEQQQEQQENMGDLLGQQPNFFDVFGRQPPAGGGAP